MTRTPSCICANASASSQPRVSGVLGRWIGDEVGLARRRRRASRPSRRPSSRKRSARHERVVGEHAHAEALRARGHELADAAEAEDAERLLVDLDAAELRALPLAARSATACACGMLRASASISATVCSAAAMMFDCGALATMMPRLVAASTSTLSTPMPARPITLQVVGALDQVGGQLGRRADQDPVVVADALGELLVVPVDADVDVEALAQQVDAGVGDLLLDEDAVAARSSTGAHAAAATPASRNTRCAAPTPAPCSTSWPSCGERPSRGRRATVRMSKAPK